MCRSKWMHTPVHPYDTYFFRHTLSKTMCGALSHKDILLGLSLTSPPGPLSKYWRGGEKRILKSPLHAMGRGFRGGVNA